MIWKYTITYEDGRPDESGEMDGAYTREEASNLLFDEAFHNTPTGELIQGSVAIDLESVEGEYRPYRPEFHEGLDSPAPTEKDKYAEEYEQQLHEAERMLEAMRAEGIEEL